VNLRVTVYIDRSPHVIFIL